VRVLHIPLVQEMVDPRIGDRGFRQVRTDFRSSLSVESDAPFASAGFYPACSYSTFPITFSTGTGSLWNTGFIFSRTPVFFSPAVDAGVR